MVDCTKTADFLREFGRMCGNGNCQECPIWREKAIAIPCVNYIQNHQAEVLAIVQKWSDEHPAQTWAGKLRELLPHAPIAELMNDYCPAQIFGNEAQKSTDLCESQAACAKCWNSEYKEAP